jgi:PAS domain S-box-containing protein
MTQPIRVLMLEDVVADAELAQRELGKAGFQYRALRVDTRADFERAIVDFQPDLIISDHNLPSFNGRDALAIVQARGLNIPVILCTGSLDEETAVEYMKAGAADYVLKDRPVRLGLAVRGALERKAERDAKSRAEAARRESEERLGIVIQATNDAVWDWDPAAQKIWVNENFWNLFGYRPEAVSPDMDWWWSRVHPDDHGRVVAAFEAFLAGDGHTWSDEYRFRRADGTYAYALNRGHVLRDETGRALRMIGAITDITRLVSAEQKYRSIFDAAPFGIFQASAEGRILTANPTLARFLGYDSSQALLGLHLPTAIYQDPTAFLQLVNLSQSARIIDQEIQWKRRDGASIWVQLSVRAIMDSGGVTRFFEGFVREINEQKLLEAQLRQAQKIEAVGQLAGGVAHDFNNILTAVLGYADMLKEDLGEELGEDNQYLEDVEEIRHAATRAASLTRQLLAFSRRQVMEMAPLDLNEIVSNLDKMLRRLIGENITLRAVLAEDLGTVRADAGQLEQVIMNLVVNARDALPKGGQITIQTGNIDLDVEYASRHAGVTPGPYVLLAVSDTGVGMTEEVKARIFEPFFTTKGPGKGTGLGLSTVYGIVKQSGGNIWVYTEPNQGTTFKIYLPRILATPVAPVARKQARRALRGSETILLVEDAEGVRTLARRVLTSNGYTVLVAARGSEALQLAQDYSEHIHLLLTDVIMPELSGWDLAQQMVKLRPGIKVLYMSGYTDEMIVHHGVLDEGIAYLQKPYTTDRLVERVREVLDPPDQTKA